MPILIFGIAASYMGASRNRNARGVIDTLVDRVVRLHDQRRAERAAQQVCSRPGCQLHLDLDDIDAGLAQGADDRGSYR